MKLVSNHNFAQHISFFTYNKTSFLGIRPEYSYIGKVSYKKAHTFCTDQGKVLCSYKDYCPDGWLSEPIHGRGAGKSVWAAISDLENDWVQIADDRICQRHSTLYGYPSWGENHGCCENNEVLCCGGLKNGSGCMKYKIKIRNLLTLKHFVLYKLFDYCVSIDQIT